MRIDGAFVEWLHRTRELSLELRCLLLNGLFLRVVSSAVVDFISAARQKKSASSNWERHPIDQYFYIKIELETRSVTVGVGSVGGNALQAKTLQVTRFFFPGTL